MLWIFNLLMILTWIQLLHFVNLTPHLPEGFRFLFVIFSADNNKHMYTHLCEGSFEGFFPALATTHDKKQLTENEQEKSILMLLS